MTDREIDALLDKHLYPEREKQWDTKCRVCGEYRSKYHSDGWCKGEDWGRRADDPLPHTTSWEQVMEDQGRLTDRQWAVYVEQLIILLGITVAAETPYVLLRATPRQRCITMLRVFGVEVEG